MPDEFVTKEELFKWIKEFQEYKAKHDERDNFWKERIIYVSIIVGLVVALISMIY